MERSRRVQLLFSVYSSSLGEINFNASIINFHNLKVLSSRRKSFFNEKFFPIFPRKSRQSATPLFRCKKTLRPKTRSQRKNEVNSVSTNHDDESTSVDDDNKNCSNNDITKRKGGKNQINGTINLMPRGGDFTTSEASASSDAVDIYSNHFNKLCSIVDKLQDHEW